MTSIDVLPQGVPMIVRERVARLMTTLHPDSQGHLDVHVVRRTLQSAGLDATRIDKVAPLPPPPASTPGSGEASGEEPISPVLRAAAAAAKVRAGPPPLTQESLAAALELEVSENELPFLDDPDGALTAAAVRGTVTASRLVISARLNLMRAEIARADSLLRRAFEVVHLVSIVYVTGVIFHMNLTLLKTENSLLYGGMCVAHALWLLDIVWSLRLPCRDPNGRIVRDLAGIAKIKRAQLIVDVVSVFPVDMVLYWFAEPKSEFLPRPPASHPILLTFLVLRFVKLTKVARIVWLLEFVNVDNITPGFIHFYFLFKPMARILAAASVFLQFIMCVDLHVEKEDFAADPLFLYVDELVRVIAVFTSSGPGVDYYGSAGVYFELVLIICGLFMQAAVISNLSVTVFRNDVSAMNVAAMRETLGILQHFRVPPDVSTEILSFQLHALNDDVSHRMETLATLPPPMQQEMLLYVKVASVAAVKLWARASQECKMAIAARLEQAVVSAGADIVAIGDVGEEMFLLAYGYASVIVASGQAVAMLSRGDYFGELALLLPDNVRQATVRAMTYCDLWVLGKADFWDVAGKFPNLLHAMEGDLAAKGVRRTSHAFVAGAPPPPAAQAPQSPPPPPAPNAGGRGDANVTPASGDAAGAGLDPLHMQPSLDVSPAASPRAAPGTAPSVDPATLGSRSPAPSSGILGVSGGAGSGGGAAPRSRPAVGAPSAAAARPSASSPLPQVLPRVGSNLSTFSLRAPLGPNASVTGSIYRPPPSLVGYGGRGIAFQGGRVVTAAAGPLFGRSQSPSAPFMPAASITSAPMSAAAAAARMGASTSINNEEAPDTALEQLRAQTTDALMEAREIARLLREEYDNY